MLIVFVAMPRIIVHERAVVVTAGVPGHRHFPKMRGRRLREMGDDVGEAFGPPVAASACGEGDGAPLYLQVHRRVTECEELVPRFDPGKPRFLLAFSQAPEEALHGVIEAEIDLVQELAVDGIEVGVMPPTRLERLLGSLPPRPAFPGAQAHHPPVVEAPALALHVFQRRGVLLAHLDLDLLRQQHLILLAPAARSGGASWSSWLVPCGPGPAAAQGERPGWSRVGTH